MILQEMIDRLSTGNRLETAMAALDATRAVDLTPDTRTLYHVRDFRRLEVVKDDGTTGPLNCVEVKLLTTLGF